MSESRTNTPTIPIYKDEILVQLRTNYSKIVTEVPRELVRQVCTIYSRSEQATRIINWILENSAFTVPTLRYETQVAKRTAYSILYDLWPWVVMTDKTIEHPNPSTRGPRPHVWIVDGEDLVEGVKVARSRFNETLRQHDPGLKHIEGLRGISESIAHQLMDQGVVYGNPDQILEKCGDVSPSDRQEIVRQVFTILREYREASP